MTSIKQQQTDQREKTGCTTGPQRDYTFLAMTMNAARTALPPSVAEPLKRFPE
jgi:hypothetical protein